MVVVVVVMVMMKTTIMTPTVQAAAGLHLSSVADIAATFRNIWLAVEVCSSCDRQ